MVKVGVGASLAQEMQAAPKGSPVYLNWEPACALLAG